MRKVIIGIVCVLLVIMSVSISMADSWFETDNLLWTDEKKEAHQTIWYAWDVPEWSYMPFFRYMEDWFKPVKLPIYELEFELGDPVYL